MAQDQDPLKRLYDGLYAEKLYTKSYDDFKTKYSNEEAVTSLFNGLSSEKLYTKDLNSFKSQYFPSLGKPTEVSAQGSAPTSQTSVEPGQNVQLPTDTQPQQTGTSSLPSLAGQISQANKIAGEYGLQQGESYEIENLPGYETLVGRVDAQGRLLNPVRVNEETGEMQNIIQPVDLAPTREEAVAQNEAIKVAEMGAGEKALNSIQNMWTHIKGVPAKAAILFDQNARFDASRFLTLYGVTNLAGTNPNQLRDDAYKYLDELGSEMKQTGSIVDGLRNNDIGELASGIFNATTSLLSSMAIGATSGGAGTVLDMVGGGVYDYNTKKAEELGITTEELFKQGKGDDIAPYIINSAAAGLERIGFNGVTAAINRNLTGSAARKAGLFAFDSSKEAGTEWVQEGLSAYNEVIASGGTHEQAIEAMGQTMASDRGIEAALGGFFGAAAASGGGRAIKGIIGKSAREKATKAQDAMQQIAQDYVNNTDPNIRATLMDAAVDVSDQMLEATNESKRLFEGLSPENQERALDTQNNIDSFYETISQGSLSEATVSYLENKAKSLESELQEVLSTSNKENNEEIKSEPTEESVEVPVESAEVQPVGETAGQTQELVEQTPTQNEEETVQEIQNQEGLTPKENNNKSLSEEEYFTVPTSSSDYDGYIVIDKNTYDKWKEIDDNEKERISQAKRGEGLLGREQTSKKIKGIAMSSAAEKRKVLGIDSNDEVSRIDVSKVQVNDEYTSGDKTYKVTGFAFGQPMVSENGGASKKLNTFNNESDIRKGLLNQKKAKRDDLIEKSKVSHYGRGVTREEAWNTAVNDYGKQNEEVVQEVVAPVAETGQQDQNVAIESEQVITEPVQEEVVPTEQIPVQEQIVEPTASIEATEQNVNAQESTVQENEQTPVREEVVEESAPRSEMPPREQTNPRLKSLLKTLPRQDVEAMRGPANVGYRQDVIEAVTGERPTKKNAGINNVKSVLNKYFGLENAGSEASSNEMIRNWANFERTEFSNPDEAVRYQAENTDDPNEVLRLYSQEQPVFNERELRISEYLGEGKINLKDYQQYGDTNNLDDNIIKNRIDGSNKGIDLDVAAQELSDQLGYEITPDEIVEFVTNHPTQAAYIESTKSENQKLLENRYKELTGRSLTPKAMERFEARQARSVTDADLLSQDADMVERGITPQQVQDRQQMEVSEGLSPVQAPLPKSLLKNLSDRLKSTGLANSVRVSDSATITENLGVDGNNVNGYVDQEGNITINSDKAGLDTPVHELGHVWESVVEKENPELHARGMELIQGPDGQVYVDYVRQTQPELEGRDLYKEALAQAIGDSGARLISGQQRSVIKEWLKAVWDYIATRAGISGMSADQVSRLSLREYTDAVAVDLLSGKPYVRMPNNDILMKVPENVTNESQLNEKQKFMSDFMLRMKAKNGVSFQGFIDGSLSAQDFKDLITFFRYSAEDGQINSIQDARDAAKAMGINSPAEVDMAYKLSKVAPEGATGIKKALVPEDVLKNTDFAKMSDEEYRDLGKQLVDSGQVVPQTLVDNIISQPRALQPWEVTALQYYRTQIDSEMATISETIDNADMSVVDSYSFDVTDGDRIFGYQALAAKAEVLNKRLFDLQVVMLATANQQSAAFRLRSLMSDKDFNIVSYLAEMKAAGYVNPELEAKLKELSDELNAVRAKLRAKERTADNKIQEIEEGNINEESKKAPSKVRNKKETVSAVNAVLDSIDINSFGLPGISFQTNGVIRFQTSPNTSVSSAVSEAISKMRDNVSGNKMSVSDAIEQAIQDINAAVGEGNWDSMKFRSTVANQLVQQKIPIKVKKLYVNSNGVLIIPGEYIKDLARNGNNTIDKMVAAASAELGGSFSEYDIRNAISGYGRTSAKKRTDLDKDISYAKRVARLLSQIEDLESKGARLKTGKAVYQNNAEINALKDQIKTLEYNIEMTPEERAQLAELKYNEARRKYLNNYVAQVQDRIDAKDFAPKRRQNKYEDDPETRALRVEAEKIKNKFKAEKYRHELENRSKAEKYGQLAYEIAFNITRGASAGADLSAIGVQGAIFTAARPKEALKVFVDSTRKMWTEEQYDQYFAELQAEPYYDLARRAGLNLQLPNFYQSVQEEQFKGGLPTWLFDKALIIPSWIFAKASGRNVSETIAFSQDRLNAFRVADRNYSLVLSQARMNLFKEFLNNQIVKRGIDVKMDEKVVQQIANEVNTITMASKVPGLQGKTANDIMSALMFSARKFVSTWKILGAGLHLLAGPNRNVQLFKDAYGGIVGRGLGTLFTASVLPTAIGAMVKYMSDDDEEDDPYFYNPNFFNAKHSDFMKIKLGDTRISLFQGIDGNVVFLARQISGEYMTSSSKAIRPLNGSGTNKTRWELFLDYMINKAAPTTSITIKALGDDRSRQESVDRISESLAPMWLSGIGEQYEKSGDMFETSVLGTLGMLGLSYNNYGGAEFAQKRGTDNKKAQEIFNASGLSAYDPGVGQRSYFDGKDLAKVRGKVYEEKYLPNYQEFMTEAVISNGRKLDKSINWEVKEGVVDQLKKESYKYAEIKSSGVYATTTNFAKFSFDGTQYRLLKSQYPLKAKYIADFMKSDYKEYVEEARDEVSYKLEQEGIKGTPKYRKMLEDLYIYNIANKEANQRLFEDMESGKIKLIKSAEYYSDLDKEESND